RQSLQETGDCMVIERDRYDAKGRLLPNKVRPVPPKTFWVREWVRNGSTMENCVQGEDEVSCPRVSPNKDTGWPSTTSAPVSKAKHFGHDQKNSTPLTESQHSLSVGLQDRAYSTRRS